MPWFSTGTAAVLLAAALVFCVAAGLLLRTVRERRFLGTAQEQATYDTLHTASLAAPPLRAGLNADSAGRAGRHLRALLDVPAPTVTDASGTVLAWDGPAGEPGHDHRAGVPAHAGRAVAAGRVEIVGPGDPPCGADCPLRQHDGAPADVRLTDADACLPTAGHAAGGRPAFTM
ncbi:hypothetical protein ACWGI0_11285 [Streptomyces sp. NPDC054802]